MKNLLIILAWTNLKYYIHNGKIGRYCLHVIFYYFIINNLMSYKNNNVIDCISKDQKAKKIVLCIRGSASLTDAITDFMFTYLNFNIVSNKDGKLFI